MKDLIEALTIFAKYTDEEYPTHCEHDVLRVYVDPPDVSRDDIARLMALSFRADPGLNCFYSYRFGSC